VTKREAIIDSPFFSEGGVRLSLLGTSSPIWPIVPDRMIDGYYGVVGGMIGRGNGSTGRKPAFQH
jgi:hypothetical protein